MLYFVGLVAIVIILLVVFAPKLFKKAETTVQKDVSNFTGGSSNTTDPNATKPK
jgi:hypothetical protein